MKKPKYGADFYNKNKRYFLKAILNRVSVVEIALKLDVPPESLRNLFTRYGVKPISIRHAHSKGQEVTL